MAVKNLATKPITKLSGMRIAEISLVDDPASPGADVILMKRRDALDQALALLRPADPLAEAIELLAKRDVSDEPRDERGRWVHQAVAALSEAKTDASAHLSTLPARAIRHLYRQAKQAAQGVAGSIKSGTTKGFTAIKNTKLLSIHPVSGGGVHFEFEHEYKTGAKLQTKVQLRPDHLKAIQPGDDEHPAAHAARSAAKISLAVAHHYLVSSGRPAEPAFNDADKSTWFRYEITNQPPQQSTSGPGSVFGASGTGSMFGASSSGTGSMFGASGTVIKPAAQEFRHQNGLPGYVWEGRQEPTWSLQARQVQTQKGTAETSGGGSYTMKNGAEAFIPSTRPDVQKHIEHVNNWLMSNPEQAKAARTSMTFGTPQQAQGREHFTPAGDYIPRGNESFQLGIASQYLRHRAGQAVAASADVTADLPSHMTGSAPEFAERVHRPHIILSAEEAEILGDHISDVATRHHGGQVPPELAPLMRRSEDAAQNDTPMHLSPDEIDTAWRSLDRHGDGRKEYELLRERLANPGMRDAPGTVQKRKSFVVTRVRQKISI